MKYFLMSSCIIDPFDYRNLLIVLKNEINSFKFSLKNSLHSSVDEKLALVRAVFIFQRLIGARSTPDCVWGCARFAHNVLRIVAINDTLFETSFKFEVNFYLLLLTPRGSTSIFGPRMWGPCKCGPWIWGPWRCGPWIWGPCMWGPWMLGPWIRGP